MPDPESVIRSSAVFRSLFEGRTDVELLDDASHVDDAGRTYFWIIVREPEAIRMLKYLRVLGTTLKVRRYDDQGEEVWQPADASR